MFLGGFVFCVCGYGVVTNPVLDMLVIVFGAGLGLFEFIWCFDIVGCLRLFDDAW